MTRKASLAVALTLALASPLVLADSMAGSWTVKLGVHAVEPRSDNGTLAGVFQTNVGNDAKPSIMFEYFFTDNWGLELLAAVPFRHNVQLNGVRAASLKHLPPTLSLQYHFAPGASVSPYLGLGVNYTYIFSERTQGPLAGTDLELGNSWGLAAHAGIDFRLSDRWTLGIDLRKIDIDSDARLNGDAIGTVSVDPLAYGVYFGYRF